MDLIGCRIVVRDAGTGRTVADTEILAQDNTRRMIEIATENYTMPVGSSISVLIFTENGLYESRGRVSGREGDRSSITLHGGTAKNDRQTVRYQVDIRGTVERIARGGEERLDAFEITVLNMSSGGLLLESPKGAINEGDSVCFTANTKGQKLSFTVEALRVEERQGETERIGCSVKLVNMNG